ncbi:hypothetical protein DENSPDRAFT_784822 [Dentipellis sp. KUC8613]|nr:hypothetical protein DENSPDRAFT_784822 [Dentipellis sp. KUC8613]
MPLTSNDEVPPLRESYSTVPQTPNSKRASSVIRSVISIIPAVNLHELTCFSSDTPRSIRSEPKRNVPYERQDVCKEMDGEIVTVPHASFLRDYAPWDPSEDVVEACLDELMKANIVTKDRHKFSAFKKKPKNSFKSEVAAYKFITSICDAVAKTDVPHREACFKMVQKPRSRTASETPGSSHEIDGYFKPLKSTVPDAVESESKDTPTADSAVNCEWKLDSGPDPTILRLVLQNYRKVVSAAVHVMNDDVRRMFTYSITIENERMSLWYWSRSHSAKSDWFDFTKDIHTTIRALASFVFARMDEIGYDPSIQRRLDIDNKQRKLCLVFEVQDEQKNRNRYFKTLHSVAEHLSLRVTGRLTRVFKVIEVGGFDDLAPVRGAKNRILKYVWLDAEAKTEREIQESIFKDLDQFAKKLEDRCKRKDDERDQHDKESELPEFHEVTEEDKKMLCAILSKPENYKRYFLTIDCDQQGFESKPVSPDAKIEDRIFTRVAPPTVSASLPHADTSRSHQTSATSSQQPEQKKRDPRDYVPKRQYRVVFNEVGMQDCLTALQLMFLAGWVHRDISGGNLLWFSETGKEGRGILSDLEYAKKFDPDGQGSADPKTGTPFFMAIEIQRRVYIYRQDDEFSLSNNILKYPKRQDFRNVQSLNVIHNFEHDLESMFWLLLWTITVRTGDANTQDLVASIFRQSLSCSTDREKAITSGDELMKKLEARICQELKKIVEPLAAFRLGLMWSYVNRKQALSNRATYSPLYGYVRNALEDCLKIAEDPKVPLLPVRFVRDSEETQKKKVHHLAPQTRKRTRASAKADAGSGSRKSQRISEQARSARAGTGA